MNSITRSLILLFSLASAAHGAATDFDLRGFINAQIKAGAKRITIPPGRYRVVPDHGRHLFLKDLADIEIIADGVEMTCTQTCQALGFEGCKNVTFRGVTIDYNPLPFTEGRITAMAPDKSWVEFQVFGGYPETALEERVEIYDPATRELRRETTGWEKEFQSLGEHRYRATKPKHYRYRPETDTEQVGDILVTSNQSAPGVGGHAIVAVSCVALKLQDITLYSANSFGFLEDRCDGSTYLRCKIDRRSMEEDPVKREFPRMRSLDADAFHSTQALRGPAIIDCTAKFQGDDCVNIHGQYHLVTASAGSHIRVATLGRLTLAVGDPLEFLPFKGPRPTDAVCRAIVPAPSITDEEIAFFKKVSLHSEMKKHLLEGHAKFYDVTLDHDVNLPMGSAVTSGNRTGNGFAVKGCDFGFNRSRGILIKASRGEVSGNTITHGWMAAVLVSPEYWWLESASSSDVKITGNKIIGCRRGAIEVVAPGGDGKPLPAGAHHNILISNNVFTDSPWPDIRVTSTTGLIIKDNSLTATDPPSFNPPIDHPRRWGNSQPSAVLLEQCENVQQ